MFIALSTPKILHSSGVRWVALKELMTNRNRLFLAGAHGAPLERGPIKLLIYKHLTPLE